MQEQARFPPSSEDSSDVKNPRSNVFRDAVAEETFHLASGRRVNAKSCVGWPKPCRLQGPIYLSGGGVAAGSLGFAGPGLTGLG